jgi:hypothetical protein
MSLEENPRKNMVLRTVYLPTTMDDELRRRAFDWHKSKNEIIRECVRVALECHADELFASAKHAEELIAATATYPWIECLSMEAFAVARAVSAVTDEVARRN